MGLRILSIVVAGWLAVHATTAMAAEVTLRLHHFLPAHANMSENFLGAWAQRIEEDSGGRIEVAIFPAMQLGGKPSALVDQVRDGVVDLVWTMPGYTPGRFPKTEAFELPFMAADAEATSKALMAYYDRHLRDEYADYEVLALHVHSPGQLHMSGPMVQRLEDLSGLKLRAPTRPVSALIEKLGAVSVGMPVPAVPEALAAGVIDGAMLPWEITPALEIPRLASAHTEFAEPLYASVFLLAMNRARYRSLPDELRAVIDANAGQRLAAEAGRTMDRGDRAGRLGARNQGNTIYRIEGDELERWKARAAPLASDWAAEMDRKGEDGDRLVDDARALIKQYRARTAATLR